MTLETLPVGLELPVLQQRRGPHRYTSDNQPAGRGRKKGSVDKITRDLKRGVLMGAANCGYDGAGQGGVDGFLLMCAQRFPRHYLQLIGKMLPMNLNTSAPVATMSVSVIGIESGRFLTPAEMEDLQQVEAHTVDHIPEPAPEEIKPQSSEEGQAQPDDLSGLTMSELMQRMITLVDRGT